MPKISYLARHCGPPPAIVSRDGCITDTERWPCGNVHSNGAADNGGDSGWAVGSYGFHERFSGIRCHMGFSRVRLGLHHADLDRKHVSQIEIVLVVNWF